MNKKIQYTLFLITALFTITVNAAPLAYSVNSDSGNESTDDSLYLIDLASGSDQRRGELISGGQTRLDTEGLAFDTDGILWGIDDDSLTLFPINKASGSINILDEIPLSGFLSGGGNDFGMTFSCDKSLYITSVRTRSLYRLKPEGGNELVGAEGSLGENISAIAAIGNPTKIYGLGNGQFQNGTTDSPNLYSIDPQTGTATLVGPLGAQAGEYNQGGLAFSADGTLWAITDRRIINDSIADLPSQILQIDIDTGTATLVSTTTEIGFESLAIGPPAGCSTAPPRAGAGNYAPIPTLGSAGQLFAILVLLLAGMAVLRQRQQ